MIGLWWNTPPHPRTEPAAAAPPGAPPRASNALSSGDYGFRRAVEMLLFVILGGMHSPVGPVVGAAVVQLLLDGLRNVSLSGQRLDHWRLVVYGALMVLMIGLRPQGLVAAPDRAPAPGAGKTTLFNVVTGLYEPTAGQVRFAGRDVSGLPMYQVCRQGSSRTFQNIRLFGHMTALENVLVGQHLRLRTGLWSGIFRTSAQRREEARARETARHWLDLVGLTDVAEQAAGTLPYGAQRRLRSPAPWRRSPSCYCLTNRRQA